MPGPSEGGADEVDAHRPRVALKPRADRADAPVPAKAEGHPAQVAVVKARTAPALVVKKAANHASRWTAPPKRAEVRLCGTDKVLITAPVEVPMRQ